MSPGKASQRAHRRHFECIFLTSEDTIPTLHHWLDNRWRKTDKHDMRSIKAEYTHQNPSQAAQVADIQTWDRRHFIARMKSLKSKLHLQTTQQGPRCWYLYVMWSSARKQRYLALNSGWWAGGFVGKGNQLTVKKHPSLSNKLLLKQVYTGCACMSF